MDISILNIPASAKVDLEKWAEIVIENWRYNIASRQLIHTTDLLNSFQATVTAEADGDKALISFAFQYYLRMIDMGVGKGTSLENKGALAESRRTLGTQKGNRRKAEPVYSRTLYAEIMRLGELLAENYSLQGVLAVTNEFSHDSDTPTTYQLGNRYTTKALKS